MKLPSLSSLIAEQDKILDSDPDQHLFAVGPPGCGKTSLAVLRADMLALRGSVAVVTRNRMLAASVARLGAQTYPVTTMNKFVCEHYRSHFQRNPPGYEQFAYDWTTIMAQYAALDDVAVIDHLVVDEGQNLPAAFFPWAMRYAAHTLSVFADADQGTEAYSASLADLVGAGLPQPIRLQTNHRNTLEIALVAEHFHHQGALPPAVVTRPRNGDVPSISRVIDWPAAAALIRMRYINRGRSVGVVLHRTEDTLTLQAALRAVLPEPVRIDVYTNKAPPGQEHAIMTASRGITILTSDAVIGLEFEDVFLQDLSRSLPCATALQYRRMYMLCARARESLTLLDGPNPLTAVQRAALPAPPILIK